MKKHQSLSTLVLASIAFLLLPALSAHSVPSGPSLLFASPNLCPANHTITQAADGCRASITFCEDDLRGMLTFSCQGYQQMYGAEISVSAECDSNMELKTSLQIDSTICQQPHLVQIHCSLKGNTRVLEVSPSGRVDNKKISESFALVLFSVSAFIILFQIVYFIKWLMNRRRIAEEQQPIGSQAEQ